MLQSMGLQRVGQDSMTELNRTKMTLTLINLLGFFFLEGKVGVVWFPYFVGPEVYTVLNAYLSKLK